MASTIKIQSTIDWVRTFTELVPIVGVGQFSQQPALNIANHVMQELLSYPHPWHFNRKYVNLLPPPIVTVPTSGVPVPPGASNGAFLTTLAQQEYFLPSILDIGWIERAQVEQEASTSVPKPVFDLEPVRTIARDFIIKTNYKIARDREQLANPTANPPIPGGTFVRLWPVPGAEVWRVYIDYQAKPPIITDLQQTWFPFPDEYAYVYEQGMLVEALKHAKDPRYKEEMTKYQALIAKALGYDESFFQHEGFAPERSIMFSV